MARFSGTLRKIGNCASSFQAIARYMGKYIAAIDRRKKKDCNAISHCQIYLNVSSARGGSQKMNHTKEGDNTKIYLVIKESGTPTRGFVNEGTKANCSEAVNFANGLKGKFYSISRLCYIRDDNYFIAKDAVIPPGKRKI